MSNIHIFRNPLDSTDSLHFLHKGKLIDFLMKEFPKGFDGRAVYIVNGNKIDISDLDIPVFEEDVVAVVINPAAELVVNALITALVSAAISLIVSRLFPPNINTPSFEQSQRDTIFSIGASQNAAKLGGIIPVSYGNPTLTPDYASQPWTSYRQIEVVDSGGFPGVQISRPEVTEDEQWLFYLLGIGQGQHDIEEVFVGDSKLSELPDEAVQVYDADFTVHQNTMGIIADNFNANLPTGPQFHENVITSSEVGGIEKGDSDVTTTSGGMAVVQWYPIGDVPVHRIMVDLEFNQGLYELNEQNEPQPIKVEMILRIRGRLSNPYDPVTNTYADNSAVRNFYVTFKNDGNRNMTPFRRTITVDIKDKCPLLAHEPLAVAFDRITPSAVKIDPAAGDKGVFQMDPTWTALRGAASIDAVDFGAEHSGDHINDANTTGAVAGASYECALPVDYEGPQSWVSDTGNNMANPGYITVYDYQDHVPNACALATFGPYELDNVSHDGFTRGASGTGTIPSGWGTAGYTPTTASQALITISPITGDDDIAGAEKTAAVSVTGTVTGGITAPGDTLTIVMNSNTYTGTVKADNSFSIDVPGADMITANIVKVTVQSGTVGAPGSISAYATRTYNVDGAGPSVAAPSTGTGTGTSTGTGTGTTTTTTGTTSGTTGTASTTTVDDLGHRLAQMWRSDSTGNHNFRNQMFSNSLGTDFLPDGERGYDNISNGADKLHGSTPTTTSFNKHLTRFLNATSPYPAARDANWMTIVYSVTGGSLSTPAECHVDKISVTYVDKSDGTTHTGVYNTSTEQWNNNDTSHIPGVLAQSVGYLQVEIPYTWATDVSIQFSHADEGKPRPTPNMTNELYVLPGRYEGTHRSTSANSTSQVTVNAGSINADDILFGWAASEDGSRRGTSNAPFINGRWNAGADSLQRRP